MPLELLRVSASSSPAPGIRLLPAVTKLVDTSTCIGCKACEVACQEWNDLPPETTVQMGTYQTLPDTDGELLEPDQVPRARRARRAALADAQGPVHALRGARLPHRLSRAGRHRPVHQRHRRLPAGSVHRLRLLHDRVPVQRAEVQPEDPARVQVHACASIARRSVCSRRASRRVRRAVCSSARRTRCSRSPARASIS